MSISIAEISQRLVRTDDIMRITVSEAQSANGQITKLAQAIGGYSDAYRVGFRGRSAGVWKEKRKEVGVSLLYYQKVERERVTGWVESFRSEKMDLDTSAVYANNNDRSFLGVGATVHVLVLVDPTHDRNVLDSTRGREPNLRRAARTYEPRTYEPGRHATSSGSIQVSPVQPSSS